MANPNPAGALSSSAGVRTTIVDQIKAAAAGSQAAAANAGSSTLGSPFPAGIESSLFIGLIVAMAALAYWYRRIL